jgi:hypothetical protein
MNERLIKFAHVAALAAIALAGLIFLSQQDLNISAQDVNTGSNTNSSTPNNGTGSPRP